TNSSTRKLFRAWFDNLWEESTSDLNVLSIIDEVKRNKFIYFSPKAFFVKAIKLLNKQYLLEDGVHIHNKLFDFQNLSYCIVMERLKKYGGYILANSVGLGKTYVACQTAHTYLKQNPSKRCLVIVPAKVKTEWEKHLFEFEIDNRVDLLSMGMLQKAPYGGSNNYFDYRKYALKYSLIIADEAHHFRNTTSNRRSNLENIISGNPEADLLLVSATPVNLGTIDLFQLIDLFYRGENVIKFEEQGLREIYDDTRREVRGLDDSEINRDILNRIRLIEEELSLKISWRIVQEYFQQDLEVINGGESHYKEPVIHEVKFTYPDKYKKEIFDKIVPFLQSLNYEPARLWDGEYKDEKSLTFLYKWRLYKRLESSIAAFYQSVINLRDRTKIYYTYLQKKDFLDIDSLRVTRLIDNDRMATIDQVFNSLNKSLQDKIIKRFEEDIENAEKMIDTLEDILGSVLVEKNEYDRKIERLINILYKNTEQDRPVIIFSEFTDTVNYIFNFIKNKFDKVEYIHGDSGKSKDKIIKDFKNGKINILVTTDILSEGVNIPRADTVINFDLPYNPVLLLQRAGRALRITNPKQIHIYNFTPDDDIDIELTLYETLDVRLSTILNIIGLDFMVWLLDEERVEEAYEVERNDYLENYSEYKKRFSNQNPDDLISETVPEESKIDRVLKNAIEIYSIDEELLDSYSNNDKKPFYTVLDTSEDDISYFLITEINKRITTIGQLKDSMEGFINYDENKLHLSDFNNISSLLAEKINKLKEERTSKRQIGRNLQEIINNVRQFAGEFHTEEKKDILNKIIINLENEVYDPESIIEVKKSISEIKEDYLFTSTSLDNLLDQEEDKAWEKLVLLSKQNDTNINPILTALIKYRKGGNYEI
ncbi:MAG: helicase-related protein, partial [bacterium]